MGYGVLRPSREFNKAFLRRLREDPEKGLLSQKCSSLGNAIFVRLIAHAAWMPDLTGNREREAAVEAAAPVEKSNTLRCFLPPVLGKAENGFSTATTAATADQFKNRTSHTFGRRPRKRGAAGAVQTDDAFHIDGQREASVHRRANVLHEWH